MNYKDAITKVLSPLLSFPSQLHVLVETSRHKHLVGIKSHPADHGRIIGKHGSMIQALQLLFKVLGESHDHQVWLSVETPTGREAEHFRDQKHPRWTSDPDGRRKALNDFSIILLLLVEKWPDKPSISYTDCGAHTYVRLDTKRQIPVDLVAALQTYAKAYAKTNGIWIALENCYP